MGLKKRNKVNALFNMSSLTDIIFLLLIFFMLTSSLVTPNALNLQLPGKKSSVQNSSQKGNTIKIDRKGTYFYNGNRISLSGINDQMKKIKRGNKNASIIIQTSATAPVDYVVSVMDLAWKNQIAAVVDETD
jgi:biopolymer transport protein ExbD